MYIMPFWNYQHSGIVEVIKFIPSIFFFFFLNPKMGTVNVPLTMLLDFSKIVSVGK